MKPELINFPAVFVAALGACRKLSYVNWARGFFHQARREKGA